MSKDVPPPMDLELIDNFAWGVFKYIGILNWGKGKKVLSIGSKSSSRDYLLEWFIQQGYDCTILEIFKPYVEALKEKGLNVIEGDARNVDELVKEQFDLIVWWHGPEHVSIEEAINVTDKLKKLSKGYIIYCVPHGENKSGAVDGNPANEHKSSWEPSNFLGLGMKEFHFSTSGAPNAVIIGWWKA